MKRHEAPLGRSLSLLDDGEGCLLSSIKSKALPSSLRLWVRSTMRMAMRTYSIVNSISARAVR